MNEKELQKLLKENKRKFDKAMKEFDYHSLEFDKKMSRILSHM